jgi:hypothetical protein
MVRGEKVNYDKQSLWEDRRGGRNTHKQSDGQTQTIREIDEDTKMK